MASIATYFNRIISGPDSLPNQNAVNVGDVLLTQTVTATTTADGLAVSATITLPTSARIVNFFVDTMVTPAVGGGTATAVAVTVGTAAAGTQYMSSTNLVAGGRAAPTPTTAQLLALSDVGTNTSMVMTVDPDGTISTTQGVYRLNVVYAQTV